MWFSPISHHDTAHAPPGTGLQAPFTVQEFHTCWLHQKSADSIISQVNVNTPNFHSTGYNHPTNLKWPRIRLVCLLPTWLKEPPLGLGVSRNQYQSCTTIKCIYYKAMQNMRPTWKLFSFSQGHDILLPLNKVAPAPQSCQETISANIKTSPPAPKEPIASKFQLRRTSGRFLKAYHSAMHIQP